jgi:hypothetical protein
MTLLKKLFSTAPVAPQATEAEQPPAPQLLTPADIAAVAGGPQVQNDGT